MSENWIWHPNNQNGVALFINPEVGNLPSLHIESNMYDLINQHSNDLTPVVEILYNKLKAQGIRYNYEKGIAGDGESQLIRKPKEIISGKKEGTCLDLSLLFCGLCLAHGLLPIFVLFENHSLVAVSLKFTSTTDSSQRFQKLLLDKGAVTDINVLKKMVNSKNYILVECTGFAHTETMSTISKESPEAGGRVNGLMDFKQSVDAGYKQLDYRELKFFLDVKRAHQLLAREPYPIDTKEEFMSSEKSQPQYSPIIQTMSGGRMDGGMIAVQGENNNTEMNINVAPSSQEKELTQAEAIQLLAQIEQLIQNAVELPEAEKQNSLMFLQPAKALSQQKEPNKQLIAGNLKQVADTLANANQAVVSTKSLWTNVKPILQQLVTWLDVAHNYFGF
jgi:hypothetical protein